MKVIKTLIVLAVVALILVAMVRCTDERSSRTTDAGESGQASFDMPGLPETRFQLECQSNGEPKLLFTPTDYVKAVHVKSTVIKTKDCQPPKDGCTQTTWRVVATRDALGADGREYKHRPYDLGTLVCGCTCRCSEIYRPGVDYPCCSGALCSYNAPACCGGRCVNLSLPAKNTDPCGDCGTFCREGEWCRFGVCQRPPD